MITFEAANEMFVYCPETGHVSWRRPTANAVRAGQRAGTVGPTGYRLIQVGRKRYREHRIAWLLATGAHAPHEIDHINGDKTDNRLCNLREATHAQNMQNLSPSKRGRSGLRGVSFFKPVGRWRARIMADGKEYALGYFASPQDAHNAYLAAKASLHAFQPHIRDAA